MSIDFTDQISPRVSFKCVPFNRGQPKLRFLLVTRRRSSACQDRVVRRVPVARRHFPGRQCVRRQHESFNRGRGSTMEGAGIARGVITARTAASAPVAGPSGRDAHVVASGQRIRSRARVALPSWLNARISDLSRGHRRAERVVAFGHGSGVGTGASPRVGRVAEASSPSLMNRGGASFVVVAAAGKQNEDATTTGAGTRAVTEAVTEAVTAAAVDTGAATTARSREAGTPRHECPKPTRKA